MIVIFAGPTISVEEISSRLDCRCLPPVCHGDILMLDLKEVSAIGVIDGYFEGAPSVWHKEILYAMNQGVHVYGSSSMGALRAAELYPFGMVGIGQIFHWYRDLIIEDDDEVAVLHGPAEAGYAVASDPMVNIRRTLRHAVEEGVISESDLEELITKAKNTFYKQRRWGSLLEETRWAELLLWVSEHGVDLKKEDAISLLTQMREDQSKFAEPFKTNYQFEWTNVWDAAYRSIRGERARETLSKSDSQVLSQLKLRPDQYERYASQALAAWVAAHPDQIRPGEKKKEALRIFREKNGLMTRAALLAFMEEKEIREAELEAQMETDASLLQAKELIDDLPVAIIEELRHGGIYAELQDAAKEKERVLANAGVSAKSSRVKRGSYLVWYFEQVLGVPVPLDLDRYAAINGFRDSEEFDQILIEEYLYQRCLSENSASDLR